MVMGTVSQLFRCAMTAQVPGRSWFVGRQRSICGETIDASFEDMPPSGHAGRSRNRRQAAHLGAFAIHFAYQHQAVAQQGHHLLL